MEPDLFDTEDFECTPVASDIPCPDLKEEGGAKPRAVKYTFPSSQQATLFTVTSESLQLLYNFSSAEVSIDAPQSAKFMDFFSAKHLRETISTRNVQLAQFEESDVKKAKLNANPYSLVKGDVKFRNYGAVWMSNISSLYPDLIQQNYLIPTYYFVTLGDPGGYAEYIRHNFQQSCFGEIKGYALFPKASFLIEDVDSKSFRSNEIDAKNILEFSDELLSQMGEPSAMLIVSNIKCKVRDLELNEKYMKSYIAYNILATLKLMARGGNLVIQTSSIFHRGSIELVLYLATLFEKISVIKPFSTVPHGNTRTIVALGYKGNGDLPKIQELCITLETLLKQGKDLENIADFDSVMKNAEFQTYIKKENDNIARYQILSLTRILDFLNPTESKKPLEINKKDIADRCLISWGLKEIQKEEEEENEFVDVQVPAKRPHQPAQRIVEHKEIDFDQIKRMVHIKEKKTNNEKLQSFARKKPEEIAPERSLNLSEHFNTDLKREFNDPMELLRRGKKTKKK
ncbi:unnamed protein product [Blepharisma stoltei]|uniref:Cap-specific mRNA (nucleoside-2'-O-)-methyltransferase 1 n=1 Tax=Blepharisma stoltei TaxID=1481888 RepID=A0AAU9K0P7_9CILI|nr:unnamed protein product [Blepharisma stoltei]